MKGILHEDSTLKIKLEKTISLHFTSGDRATHFGSLPVQHLRKFWEPQSAQQKFRQYGTFGVSAGSDGNLLCGNGCVPFVPVMENADNSCPENTCGYPAVSRGEQSVRLAAHIRENGQKPEPTSYVSAECQEEVTSYA